MTDLTDKPFPTFTLPDHTGRVWSDADFKKTWTVLYAYPKAMTPGCTTESCNFRDEHSAFKKIGAQVIGISADDAKRQQKFAEKESLPFPLLADTEHSLIGKLGIWIEKSMYGRKYFGIERATFLIDPSGTIRAEWRGVKVTGHVDAVYARLCELAGK